MKSEYIKKVLSLCEEGTELISEYKDAKSKIVLKCKNGHTREATTNGIVSKKSNIHCKECLGKTSSGKKTDEQVTKEFLAMGYTKLDKYLGANTKILARNNDCGHEYLVTPSSIARKRNILCPECSNRRNNYTTDLFKQECSAIDIKVLGEYINMKTNVLVEYTCGHQLEINPGHLLYDNIGITCQECSSSKSIKSRFFTKLIELDATLVSEYKTSQTSVQIINNSCNHQYEVIPNNLVCAGSGTICRICNPYDRTSQGERDLVDFIKANYTGWIEVSERAILEGKELDIVLPDLGLAIEYNGSYWHSDEYLSNTYHLDKTNMVEAFGYQLIHVMDYEWNNKQNIVKSRLLNLLKTTKTKIMARKCLIKQIDFPGAFLDQNHIQGRGTITKINYGLFYNNELVSVMTFNKPRFTDKYEYELVRFANKLNTQVVGGASKLLKHFIKQYSPKTILSYADRRYSIGILYYSLGFDFLYDTKPNYTYFKGGTYMTRYQATKQQLKVKFPEFYKDDLTEYEIMLAAGYRRIYDSGSKVFVYSVKV